jgi:hypothetical protein
MPRGDGGYSGELDMDRPFGDHPLSFLQAAQDHDLASVREPEPYLPPDESIFVVIVLHEHIADPLVFHYGLQRDVDPVRGGRGLQTDLDV